MHLKATTHEVEIGILVPDRTVNLSSDGNYVIFEDTQNWIGPLNRYKKHLLDTLITLKNDFYYDHNFTITTKGFLGIEQNIDAPASCRIILQNNDGEIEPDIARHYEQIAMALAQRIAPQPSLEVQNCDEGLSDEIINFMNDKSNEFRQAYGGTRTASGFTFMNNLNDKTSIYFDGSVPSTDMVQNERFEIEGVAKPTGYDASENQIILTVHKSSSVSGKQKFIFENPDLIDELCHARTRRADLRFFGFATDSHNGKGPRYYLTKLELTDIEKEPFQLE